MDVGLTLDAAVETPQLTRPVLIVVAFYENAPLVESVSRSLLRCSADIEAIDGEVVYYNDSPQHAPLAHALDAIGCAMQALPFRVEKNRINLGFVKTMNRAVAEAAERGMDLIMLNSDAVVEPGAFREMVWVAQRDVMHGFVNPRSDNATIATLPLQDRLGGRRGAEALAAYTDFARRLPRLSYVPTAIGFCMLVRWEILAELGGFDEIYGKGYNEENDLVMRASRMGYRAVLANQAFVAHEGEASFSTASVKRAALEQRNRAILDARYPEYSIHTRRYYDTPEVIAERLLACLIPDADGRLDAALDCSSFVAAHNGTMLAGRQTIEAAAAGWRDKYTVYVLCSEEVFAFHALAALGVIRSDPHGGKAFAMIFRIGQPYDWNTVQRLCLSGAVLGVYMLDTISLDCPKLASARLQNIWQFTVDHFDMLATQSQQTDRAMRLRLRVPKRMASVVSPHSLRLEDYGKPSAEAPPVDPQQLLVIGNHYDHKYVAPTANALALAFGDRTVVALGALADPASRSVEKPEPGALLHLTNLRGIASGALEEAEIASLYAQSAAVVFPSYAEGFGFPTLNALAAGRPVFARRLPVTEEIWRALDCNPNIHFFTTTSELVALLQTVPVWETAAVPPEPDALRPAQGIRETLEFAMRTIDYTSVVARVQAMQFASDGGNMGARTGMGEPDVAAGLVAARIEVIARSVFRQPIVFKASRLAVRSLRRLRSVWRR